MNAQFEEPQSSEHSIPPEADSTIRIDLSSDFQYTHGPFYNHRHKHQKISPENVFFIGRDKIIHNLCELLVNTRESRGCYLVSGYRGVGKTSVINKVLHNYESDNHKNAHEAKIKTEPVIVRVNLGHNTGREVDDIFYNIVTILCQQLEAKIQDKFTLKKCREYIKKYSINKKNTPFERLSILRKRISYTLAIERTEALTAGLSATIPGVYNSKIDSSKKKLNKQTFLPLGSREIEIELMNILDEIRDAKQNPLDIIFVFDEVDKISAHDDLMVAEMPALSDSYSDLTIRAQSRKLQLDYLLGILKNFITTAKARFIFAAGREALDAYYSEVGCVGSLYESIFDQVFEVPSLLTDPSDGRKPILSSMIEAYVCSRLMGDTVQSHGPEYSDTQAEKNYQPYTIANYYKIRIEQNPTYLENPSAHDYDEFKDPYHRELRYSIYVLRNFINYLAFQTWGNPKRLAATFESFIQTRKKTAKDQSKFYLEFKAHDQKRFFLASEIYTLFQHHISRQVLQISDKLTVSSLSALHFILKFYPYGFTREALYRMEEVINIHRPPEINNIIDSLLSQVLRSYLRRVRNGTFRYRFNSGFEQEIRYISFMDNLESAAFNFSLNGLYAVKRHFSNILGKYKTTSTESLTGYTKTALILADINNLEQNYDIANEYYCDCIATLNDILTDKDGTILPLMNLNEDLYLMWIEAIIKNGDLEECRSNYNRAAANYAYATKLAIAFCKAIRTQPNSPLNSCIIEGDSKLDILKQPAWLIQYLKLKRGPTPLERLDPGAFFYSADDPRFDFKQAELQFFLLDFEQSNIDYCEAYTKTTEYCTNLDQERKAYLSAYATIYRVESYWCLQSKSYWEKLYTSYDHPPAQPFRSYTIRKTIVLLNNAAETLEAGGLYNHAGLTYIRILGYLSIWLDYLYFTKNHREFTQKDEETLRNWLSEFSTRGFKMINASREASSSHTIDTWLARDVPPLRTNNVGVFENKKKFVSVIDLLLNLDEDNPGLKFLHEKPFWHHSIMGQKLIAYTLWNAYSQYNIFNSSDYKNTFKVLFDNLVIDDIPPFSTHFQIFYKWIYIRNKLTRFKESLADVAQLSIEDFKSASKLSSEIYSSIIDHRQISNNHQTLIYPLMAQYYYLQWDLLYFLVNRPASGMRRVEDRRLTREQHHSGDRIVNRDRRYQPDWRVNDNPEYQGIERRKPIEISQVIHTRLAFVQKCLLNLQPKHPKTPPSHCDLIQVTEKVLFHLNNTESMFDMTSRIRKNLLQKKYYLHDDYSDPEFRLDWTLLHIFIPQAFQTKQHVEKCMKPLENFLNKNVNTT